MSNSYNGHKNWAQWNVSLWLNNDESLYRVMLYFVKSYRNDRPRAAKYFLENLNDQGITHTPDGAKYSKTAVRAAMVGI